MKPTLSREEQHWIRTVAIESQSVQDRITRLCKGHLKEMGVYKATVRKVRDTIYGAKHKLFMYIFDGKGAYRPDDSTTYDLRGLLTESEYRDANSFFPTVKRATVAGKQKIPNAERFRQFLLFLEKCDRQLD